MELLQPKGTHSQHLYRKLSRNVKRKKEKRGFCKMLLCDRGGVCDDVAMNKLMKRCTESEKMMTNYGIQVP